MSNISLKKIKKLITSPLNKLVFKAQQVHNKNFKDSHVQLASLISIKTGLAPLKTKALAVDTKV